MKAIHSEVTHIEDRVGPRGGAYWTLTLSCGHHAFRPKPRFDAGAFVSPMIGSGDKRSQRATRERQLRQLRGAPLKVKCIICNLKRPT